MGVIGRRVSWIEYIYLFIFGYKRVFPLVLMDEIDLIPTTVLPHMFLQDDKLEPSLLPWRRRISPISVPSVDSISPETLTTGSPKVPRCYQHPCVGE